MKAVALIRRNEDGVTRRYPIEWEPSTDGDEGVSEYMWGEGNYACDCNRAMFFAEAGGEDEPEDAPCGEDAFSVRIEDDKGALLQQDHGWSLA